MDAAKCAGENTPRWEARASEALAHSGCDAAFAVACQATNAGTDVDAAKMAYVLNKRQLDPTVTILGATLGLDEATNQVYERGDWGPRRKAVELGLNLLGTALYATLDLPGRGSIERYGDFRLVYEPHEDAVVLPHNSALYYIDDVGSLNEEMLCADVASWSSRGDLAVAERSDIAAGRDADWADVIGDEDGNGDLIEAISAAPVTETAVATIRVREETLDAAEAAFFRAAANGVPAEELPAIVTQLMADPLGTKLEGI